MGERQFCRSLLRISMAQICQELGWHSIQTTPCDLMTDILQRYIQQLATISSRSAEHYGRTEPNLDDLGLAFRQVGVSLYELENYIRDVDPVPFKHDVPRFPLKRKNDLQHPEPGSRDDRERLQYIPAYLPPIIGSDDFGAPITQHRDSILSTPGSAMETDSSDMRHLTPGVNHISPRGEKREMASPQFSEQAMKRLRLDGDGTPQELTAVSIGVTGELTPKRIGKLPIATTPPQRVIKAMTNGSGVQTSKGKALTGGVLSHESISDRFIPNLAKGSLTPGVQRTPISPFPGTSKQKALSKDPLNLMFTPNTPTRYPSTKSKDTPSDDEIEEFHFPPPKSPKSAAFIKKPEKVPVQLTKKEKKALKVFEFDDDDFDVKPKRDVESSPLGHIGSYKEPSPFVVHDDGKNDSGKEIRMKKIDKEKKKSINKDKVKIKGKLKLKKNKENLSGSREHGDVKEKKSLKLKTTKKKGFGLEKKTPKFIKEERHSSSDGEMKLIKKKFKKAKEKDKSKELKVKKLKQKSREYKIKSKVKKEKLSPTSFKQHDDSSSEKQPAIGKFSFIKSGGSGSKLQFKIARPSSEGDNMNEKKFDKKKGLPKVKRLKASSSEVESSDKEQKPVKKKLKKEASEDSIKKEKEEKIVSTPVVPKITFKLGGTPVGSASPKVTIKTPSPPSSPLSSPPPSPSPPPPSPPPSIPKLSISMSSKKGKEVKAKIITTPKTETKPRKEVKSEVKIKKEPIEDFDSEIKKKKETKTKAELKLQVKAEPKKKASKKRDSDWDSGSDIERKPRKEIKKEENLELSSKKEKTEKEPKKKKVSKVKEEEKPKANISPFDFDAPSPPRGPGRPRKDSTPKKEPPPGIFAPSEPYLPTMSSGKSSPASSRSSPAAARSTRKSSAPPPTPPPTKAALKALPPLATKGAKGSKKEKKPLSPAPPKVEPPKEPEEPCSLISETVGIVINEHGEKIWYCPGCRQPDDGIKPMVGCDRCDDWYHWECVGLDSEPDSDEWYCVKCKKKPKGKKGRKPRKV